MKQESNLKPKNKFEIENIQDNRCEVVFFDLESIEEEKQIDENNKEQIIYKYNSYRQKMTYNSNLSNYLDSNYEVLLNKAKEIDYRHYADKVRNKRNNLLKESDKEMVLDRLNLNLPESVNITNMLEVLKSFFDTLKNIKNNEWAEYRQELRDITEQSGFPYNVEFPKKPKNNIEE